VRIYGFWSANEIAPVEDRVNAVSTTFGVVNCPEFFPIIGKLSALSGKRRVVFSNSKLCGIKTI